VDGVGVIWVQKWDSGPVRGKITGLRSSELKTGVGRFCGEWVLVAYAHIFTVVVAGCCVLLDKNGGGILVLLLSVFRRVFGATENLDRVCPAI